MNYRNVTESLILTCFLICTVYSHGNTIHANQNNQGRGQPHGSQGQQGQNQQERPTHVERNIKLNEQRVHVHETGGHGQHASERIHVRHSGLEGFRKAEAANVLDNQDFVRNKE